MKKLFLIFALAVSTTAFSQSGKMSDFPEVNTLVSGHFIPVVNQSGSPFLNQKISKANLATTIVAAAGFSLLGNAGTVDGTNFIGTTDNIPFNIRVNNQKAGRIDHLLLNTFFGYQAGNDNTTGSQNTASGVSALLSNTTGLFNTANGSLVLISNTTGSQNTASGVSALQNNTTGTGNTAIGYNANVSTGALTNATAIGTNAVVGASNTIQFGDAGIVALYTSGNSIQRNPTLTAVNSTATVTATQIVSGYFTSTSAGAVTLTTPTATQIATEIGGTAVRGTSLYFSVDNNAGANTVTLVLDASITVNTPAITGGDNLLITTTNAIGLFRLVFISGTAAKIFRIH